MATITSGLFRTGQAAGFGIEVEITPAPIIMVAELDALSRNISNFKEPLTKSIKEVMMPSIRLNFQMQGRPAWAPLSQATLNRRKYDGRGVSGRILSRTTRLLRRATSFKIWTVNETEAFVSDLGDDVWYGKIHQGGFEGGGSAIGRIIRGGVPQRPGATLRAGDEVVEGYAGDIPARPFLVVQPEDEEAIQRVFERWIDETLAKAGF